PSSTAKSNADTTNFMSNSSPPKTAAIFTLYRESRTPTCNYILSRAPGRPTSIPWHDERLSELFEVPETATWMCSLSVALTQYHSLCGDDRDVSRTVPQRRHRLHEKPVLLNKEETGIEKPVLLDKQVEYYMSTTPASFSDNVRYREEDRDSVMRVTV
ncbi:unnamed protein product, partial [Ectocarpus sp. 4 AP-2014]